LLYPRNVVEARRIGRVALTVGVAASLGRWPWHWRHHPWLAVAGAVVVIAVVAGLWTAHRAAATRAAVALCLVDAVVVIHAWSARVPLHCDCVRRAGAPALAGWGGGVIAFDVALSALAVWLSRPVAEKADY
jgi:hypothetical protein